jgi:hypothetical protein
MVKSKATRSAGRNAIPSRRRILRFPRVKGKTIELVELSASLDEYTIDIRFEDKTVLTFDVEACFFILPELLDWKTGNYKLLKRWRPFHSGPPRV